MVQYGTFIGTQAGMGGFRGRRKGGQGKRRRKERKEGEYKKNRWFSFQNKVSIPLESVKVLSLAPFNLAILSVYLSLRLLGVSCRIMSYRIDRFSFPLPLSLGPCLAALTK